LRLLFWLVIAVAAVMWLQYAKKSRLKTNATQRRGAAAGDAESMVRCAHCGIHIPASEALGDPAGAVFCSEEHRLLHRVE
jgi:uncharacterized protein